MDLARLSRLERWILYAAYDNRVGAADDPQVDLYYHEVLFSYFGFPMRQHTDEPLHSLPGARRFERDAIGRVRYDAAHAAVSRAFRRLEARGLAEPYVTAGGRRAGLRLTDAAVEAASKLGQQTAKTSTLPPEPDS